jgi:hypothetical protein
MIKESCGAMLEQWVTDKLNPLKAEKLVILADPQRMIRSGAQAVDGWAKSNGWRWSSPRTATYSVAAMARLRSKRSSEHLKTFFGTSMVSPQSPSSMATSWAKHSRPAA